MDNWIFLVPVAILIVMGIFQSTQSCDSKEKYKICMEHAKDPEKCEVKK